MSKKKDTVKPETVQEEKFGNLKSGNIFMIERNLITDNTSETGPNRHESGYKKPEKRKLDVLRIRKSNTRNQLFESDLGKQFIAAARAEVKNSEIEEDKYWFIVWEILEDQTNSER